MRYTIGKEYNNMLKKIEVFCETCGSDKKVKEYYIDEYGMCYDECGMYYNDYDKYYSNNECYDYDKESYEGYELPKKLSPQEEKEIKRKERVKRLEEAKKKREKEKKEKEIEEARRFYDSVPLRISTLLDYKRDCL